MAQGDTQQSRATADLAGLPSPRSVRLGHSPCIILASSLEALHLTSSRAALGAGAHGAGLAASTKKK